MEWSRRPYGRADGSPQVLHFVYSASAAFCPASDSPGVALAGLGGSDMAGLAMVLFIALFTFGGQYFGWTDGGGWIQLSLASSFIFGIICGFRVKG
jgi:hypothetical protein